MTSLCLVHSHPNNENRDSKDQDKNMVTILRTLQNTELSPMLYRPMSPQHSTVWLHFMKIWIMQFEIVRYKNIDKISIYEQSLK